ncbi:hypothetical protein ACTFIY_012037 [Dictyostelium cf. discoideum]
MKILPDQTIVAANQQLKVHNLTGAEFDHHFAVIEANERVGQTSKIKLQNDPSTVNGNYQSQCNVTLINLNEESPRPNQQTTTIKLDDQPENLGSGVDGKAWLAINNQAKAFVIKFIKVNNQDSAITEQTNWLNIWGIKTLVYYN